MSHKLRKFIIPTVINKMSLIMQRTSRQCFPSYIQYSLIVLNLETTEILTYNSI